MVEAYTMNEHNINTSSTSITIIKVDAYVWRWYLPHHHPIWCKYVILRLYIMYEFLMTKMNENLKSFYY